MKYKACKKYNGLCIGLFYYYCFIIIVRIVSIIHTEYESTHNEYN